jgi:ubiquinone/menaquinone biosynthesis C-methylase UbiE
MEDVEQTSPELRYFDMLADIGITKHMGSLKATEEMVGLCQIGADSYVLDVGCGVGLTPSYLARNYGCRVMGVDIFPGMIERSKEQAQRDQVEDRVEFRVADAQELPFEDDLFDAVIVESVNVFVPDMPRAFEEYARVTKPGGYVGMNESTWLEPPAQDAVDYMAKIGARLLTAEEWEALLVGAGLQDVVARAYRINYREEAKGRVKRFGFGGMMRGLLRIFPVYFRNPSAQAVLKQAFSSMPRLIAETMGYGVYVGRKA